MYVHKCNRSECKKYAAEFRLNWDSKWTHSFIFFAHIHHTFFLFFSLFPHPFSHQTHTASFLSKEIGLVFLFLNLFFSLSVCSFFFFYSGCDFLDYSMICAGVLLYFSSKYIEIYHSFGKTI